MKALVIEYFGGDDRASTERRSLRSEREKFWRDIQAKGGGYLEVVLSGQEKTRGFLLEADGQPFVIDKFDMLFIHSGDRHYGAPASETYIKLARDKGKPYVCYSGGAERIRAPRLAECQIELLPLQTLKDNIEGFFNEVVRRRAITPTAFYVLAGIDPRLEATLALLNLFLPLDIELQLQEDEGYVERCKHLARELEEQSDQMAELISQITGQEISEKQIKNRDREAVAIAKESGEAVRLLIDLFEHMARIKADNSDRALLVETFGYANGKRHGGTQPDALVETGFHRTYESLRDHLLAAVEASQEYGR
jgi:hypothetical protein